jgi:cytochrome c553
MKLRKILAKRLTLLMQERLNLDTQAKVGAAAGMSQSTVGRRSRAACQCWRCRTHGRQTQPRKVIGRAHW